MNAPSAFGKIRKTNLNDEKNRCNPSSLKLYGIGRDGAIGAYLSILSKINIWECPIEIILSGMSDRNVRSNNNLYAHFLRYKRNSSDLQFQRHNYLKG